MRAIGQDGQAVCIHRSVIGFAACGLRRRSPPRLIGLGKWGDLQAGHPLTPAAERLANKRMRQDCKGKSKALAATLYRSMVQSF